MMMNVGHPTDFSSNFYHFTVIAVYVNSCLNPIIYGLKYKQFQKASRKLLSKYCRCIAPAIMVEPELNTVPQGTMATGASVVKY